MSAGLGPLEMQVLGLLDATEGRSVGDVQARLAEQGQESAYTTVMTVLGRLHEKKLVLRDKDGRRYVYRTASRAAPFKQRLLQRMQRALFSDRLAPIAALIDQDLDRGELHALKRLIDEKLKESK
ncbi:MAG TPA: BlaI/MecI/CopY family transcriptional regulator [Polyangiales bacterium]|nr:BlaI/MecI/CopY family transcriptional regulator [Polyangiales bacterium]